MVNNILIIGNGFDLAHGLPTRYTDFLSLVKNWRVFYNAMPKEQDSYKSNSITPYKTNDLPLQSGKIDADSVKAFSEIDPQNYEWYNIMQFDEEVRNNPWIRYFLDIKFNKEKWIDFEKEIENVVLTVKRYYDTLPSLLESGKSIFASYDDETKKIIRIFSNNNDIFIEAANKTVTRNLIKPSNIVKSKTSTINNMKIHLDGLINALRIYFVEFVDKINSNNIEPAISKIEDANVLSFNYTNYIERYTNIKSIHYIHGNINYDTFKNNMVLGINDENIQDNDFVYFFKYFQRIQKRTGNLYKEFVAAPDDDIKFCNTAVYIFGHSLDANDKSILSWFFENPNVDKIAIYYHDQIAYESQVINLIKMFGRDFVVDNISNKKIEFISIRECKLNNAIPVFH